MKMGLLHMMLMVSSVLVGQQVQISTFADWHVEQPQQEIIIGEDINETHSTAPDHVLLAIQPGSSIHMNKINVPWRVRVHREDRDWLNRLRLFIRRNGEGSGERYNKSLSGGTTFKQINKGCRTFFKGKGWQYDIPKQLEITGLSLTYLLSYTQHWLFLQS